MFKPIYSDLRANLYIPTKMMMMIIVLSQREEQN